MEIYSPKALELPPPPRYFISITSGGKKEDIAMRQNVEIGLLCQIFLTAALLQWF